ncbi:hypothetical protein MYXA107069_03215 [Myxococcus xanthus]|nr:hypothetical protein MyxoNM_01065 [Myxococcus xanthus]SDX35341.1 hypothetical protein SAMN05444383_107105 [Myxococcus xanthus]
MSAVYLPVYVQDALEASLERITRIRAGALRATGNHSGRG